MVQLGRVEQLPPGEMAEVEANGTTILVCNTGVGIYAVQAECPHQGAPLSQGMLHDYMLVCPWHAWEFDCRSGFGPCGSLETYPVRTEGGVIYLNA